AQNPPKDLHPLLLLPGVLPQGRIESPAHQVGTAAEPVIRGTQASPWCPRGGVRPKGSDGGDQNYRSPRALWERRYRTTPQSRFARQLPFTGEPFDPYNFPSSGHERRPHPCPALP